ncbi:hypothetical protein D9M73_56870 [compost metagenome]
MNPQAELVRDLFLRAAGPGTTAEPAAARALLGRSIVLDMHNDEVDALERMEHQLVDDLPYRNALLFQDKAPSPDELDRWEAAVRWVLQALKEWDSQKEGALPRLQVLLSVLGLLDDVACTGTDAVIVHLPPGKLKPELVKLMTAVGTEDPQDSNRRSAQGRLELRAVVQQDNLERLKHLTRNAPQIVHSHIWMAVHLLWKLDPRELAHIIRVRNDPVVAMGVCEVLRDDAATFALEVDNTAFKFLSVPYALRAHSSGVTGTDWRAVLCQMTIQVAQTPQWKAWLEAWHKYPSGTTLLDEALADALTQLPHERWNEFVNAIQLGTYRGSAQSYFDILRRFAASMGEAGAKPMWEFAFRRWDTWNYGKGEEHNFMSAPAACALDYPVCMYYSQQPAQMLADLEAELATAVDNIEQLEWFPSESAVITERNRLLSRLRLVGHARAIAAGEAPPLAASITQDEYSVIRYRYFNSAK